MTPVDQPSSEETGNTTSEQISFSELESLLSYQFQDKPSSREP